METMSPMRIATSWFFTTVYYLL